MHWFLASREDGAYLAQLLLRKGYEVWGTSRDAENPFNNLKRLGIFENVRLLSMAPENFDSVVRVFADVNPVEVYSLTGQSSVGASFAKPLQTISSIALATVNQLEAIRLHDKTIKF